MSQMITGRKLRLPATVFIVALTLSHISACKRESVEASRAVTVTLLVDSRIDPLRNMQIMLLERLVRQRAGYDFRFWDAGADEKKQTVQLASAMKLKPDVLMVFPVKTDAIAAQLKDARESGVRIFVFAADMPENSCTSAIYCDERKLGRLAGEFIVQSVRQKITEEGRPEAIGCVVQLTGPEGNVVSAQRKEGFAEALAKQPGISIVHEAPAGLNGEGAADRINEALAIQKKIDVIFAHNDIIARAAAMAVTVAGMRDNVLVMGVDGAMGKGGGIQMVTGSEIDVTLYHPPLVDFAWDIAQRCLQEPGFKPAPRNELKPVVVNLEKAIELTRSGPPMPVNE
ncbi:MAG: substrate-binding domain-containing protein [Verrucomicrobiaceae bacterium]